MSEKKGKTSQSGRTHLNEEDEEIWEHVRRSVKPLKGSRLPSHTKNTNTENLAPLLKERSTSLIPKSVTGTGEKTRILPSSPTKKTSSGPKVAQNDLPDFSKNYARKLRRGHLEIEARIDLHGMRQHEAHRALKRFLQASVAKGKRWVLVITGKGSSALRTPEEDHGLFLNEQQRGVLKRNVPLWLAEPEMRPLVVSFTEAAIEHGGSGALYIHLRRSRKD